jgi:hypothetical protein
MEDGTSSVELVLDPTGGVGVGGGGRDGGRLWGGILPDIDDGLAGTAAEAVIRGRGGT